jgi:hypothetical protein
MRGSHLVSDPARSSRADLQLSPAQRDHLISVLHQLEGVLAEIRHAAMAKTREEGVLRREIHDLPTDFWRTAEYHMADIARHLETVAVRLTTGPQITSWRERVHLKLTQCLFELLDAGSHGMHGFGPIDAQSSAELDQIIVELRHPVEALMAGLVPPAQGTGFAEQLSQGAPGRQRGDNAADPRLKHGQKARHKR